MISPSDESERNETIWTHKVETPLRRFLRTEVGGATLVLASAVGALIWLSVDAHSYERVRNTMLPVRTGHVAG